MKTKEEIYTKGITSSLIAGVGIGVGFAGFGLAIMSKNKELPVSQIIFLGLGIILLGVVMKPPADEIETLKK